MIHTFQAIKVLVQKSPILPYDQVLQRRNLHVSQFLTFFHKAWPFFRIHKLYQKSKLTYMYNVR